MTNSTSLDPWPALLHAVANAPQVLGPAAEQVAVFLASCQHEDGGFVGRDGSSDVYYACFATAILETFQQPYRAAELAVWLKAHPPAVDDLPHLASWLRCRVLLPDQHRPGLPGSLRRGLLGCLAGCGGRLDDWNPQNVFLAASVAGSLGQELPERGQLAKRIDEWLQEHPTAPTGQLAAAGVLLQQDSSPVPPDLADRLRTRQIQGGWCAHECRPVPDLLDTAVAVHALRVMDEDLGCEADLVLDYVDSLWNSTGAFHGHWADDHLDAEYTFYGLLTIGWLAEPSVHS
jgi:hypothetical protein